MISVMHKICLFCLCLLVLPARAAEPDWAAYARLLESHVSPGSKDGLAVNQVDYEALRQSPVLALAVEQVRAFDVSQLETVEEKLAFYINVYNLLTLQLIVDHWPVESIRDIGSFLKGPWDQVVLENAAGELTLDDIEHKIIRSFGEPRIHFAVNCASVSCPDLRREPYTAAKLDQQLDEQTRLFFEQPGKGMTVEGDTARVTRLLDWYEGDFDAEGGVLAFVKQYSNFSGNRVKANLKYNWGLNGLH